MQSTDLQWEFKVYTNKPAVLLVPPVDIGESANEIDAQDAENILNTNAILHEWSLIEGLGIGRGHVKSRGVDADIILVGKGAVEDIEAHNLAQT